MNGAGAPIFFAFIRLCMSDCACKTWESTTFMHTSPGWLRGPLSGSPNFFQSLLALPRTQTTFLRQGHLRLVWINLSRLARVIITETDYSEKFLRERFPGPRRSNPPHLQWIESCRIRTREFFFRSAIDRCDWSFNRQKRLCQLDSRLRAAC